MAKLVLQNVTLGLFPNLFKAEAYKESEPRYTASFIIPHNSAADKQIRQAINDAAKEEFGPKWEKWLKTMEGQANKYCYLDAEMKNSFNHLEGMVLSSARQEKKGPPLIINRNKSPITAESGIIYPGCMVNGVLSIYIQQGDYPGVRCGLNTVQFVADGEPLSSDVPTADDLPSLDDPEDDPLAGLV